MRSVAAGVVTLLLMPELIEQRLEPIFYYVLRVSTATKLA